MNIETLSLIASLLFVLMGMGFFLLALSTSKKRRVENSLREQNIFLQTLVESMPSPVFYKDLDGVYLGCNDAFLAMLGRSKDEVVGKTVYDISPPELAEVYEKADNALFADGTVQRYETQVKFADGNVHEILFTKAVYRDTQGVISGLLGIMLDISDRKLAEEQLKRSQAELEKRVADRTSELAQINKRLELEVRERQEAERESRQRSDFLNTVIESFNHGLIVIDVKDYSIKLANSAACEGKCFVDIKCHELIHDRESPCSEDGEVCPLEEVRQTGKPAVVSHTHIREDGTPHYVEIHAYPVFGDDGEVIQVIENFMDVTERKQSEIALLEAKVLAENTSRHMSEFLNTVSHELRTPMTSVQGFAKLIDKSFMDNFSPLASDDVRLREKAGRIKSNIQIIISESERLTALINDHLNLSKLEAGRSEWRKERIVPSELVQRAEAATSSLFNDSNLMWRSDIEEELPEIVCDTDRILQVLINLISNAVKFALQGDVVCRACRANGDVQFSISDSGVGISPDQLENVFSKFTQIYNDDAGKPAGTGLGLAISREIIRHHGGKIWVESEIGQGSTFYFTLPVSDSDSADIPRLES